MSLPIWNAENKMENKNENERAKCVVGGKVMDELKQTKSLSSHVYFLLNL
jgi:hypothetical protein